ncbi:NADH dehydrogenase [ubiquinone] 1 alpha subcomplex subunit 10, mitochondrial [Portunus trituberculatus]|uniref:NADH dehydrogenase [ubiquinone] 1 alpha subcomplex subunit 10, mitochondrial n=1 Tax=Portunus trituberculatus TaxID=210409 RepID=A0A5B7FHM5_PORTR|nr:NADH dehydrogenase [ubiquinone] 1 alpha subcomplex subunit 10, mitochondrial [Portunus trituberculatus]
MYHWQELAEELDMMYMPEANMDMVYINPYGYNMRQLDPQLPDSCKSYDEKDFLTCPSHPNAPKFQFDMLKIRLEQYVDALAHVLNTGQGVVMDRSVYSDCVFMETMVQFGYMSKEARMVYYESRARSMPVLMRPHLVIYLDVPVKEVQRRVAARPPPYPNSLFSKPEVLAHMEHVYKQQYLKEISTHAELLIYDWTESGDVEVVVEDIERINFDDYGPYDPKMADWRIERELDWSSVRIKYSKYKHRIVHSMSVPAYSVDELIINAEDANTFKNVWWNAPGMKYEVGFNADQGDQFIALKTKAGFI